MSEKEKMLAGENYNPADAKLYYERIKVKNLCMKYNQLRPEDTETRKNYLHQICGKIGSPIHIEPVFFCDYGYNIEIGNNFYANHNLVILDCAKVKIGNNVLIGPNCGIYTACHPLNIEERNSGIEFAKPIYIEDNVWIGGNVCILPGVTIGQGAVIGAGSVVTKNIPPNVVAAGNPCRLIK